MLKNNKNKHDIWYIKNMKNNLKFSSSDLCLVIPCPLVLPASPGTLAIYTSLLTGWITDVFLVVDGMLDLCSTCLHCLWQSCVFGILAPDYALYAGVFFHCSCLALVSCEWTALRSYLLPCSTDYNMLSNLNFKQFSLLKNPIPSSAFHYPLNYK